jgi:hypothetical protein
MAAYLCGTHRTASCVLRAGWTGEHGSTCHDARPDLDVHSVRRRPSRTERNQAHARQKKKLIRRLVWMQPPTLETRPIRRSISRTDRPRLTRHGLSNATPRRVLPLRYKSSSKSPATPPAVPRQPLPTVRPDLGRAFHGEVRSASSTWVHLQNRAFVRSSVRFARFARPARPLLSLSQPAHSPRLPCETRRRPVMAHGNEIPREPKLCARRTMGPWRS